MEMTQRRQRFFNEQYTFGKNYLHTFLGKSPEKYNGLNVLEVGGGEFGLLKALEEYGALCTGIDISESRVQFAKKVHKNSSISFHVGDICNYDSIAPTGKSFDVIVLRDVIEHIPDQESALNVCAQLLAPAGLIYISFPPIYSPFGGHQQNFKYGKALPYIHILPNPLYRFILKSFGAEDSFIDVLLETKSTGITIRHMFKIFKKLPLNYVFKKCYLVRPDFEIRFHLKRRSCVVLNNIPILQEIFSTGCLLTLQKK